MSVVKRFGRDHSFRNGGEGILLRIAGDGGVETTVDQTLIRGLVTARPRIRLGPASVPSRASMESTTESRRGLPYRASASSDAQRCRWCLCRILLVRCRCALLRRAERVRWWRSPIRMRRVRGLWRHSRRWRVSRSLRCRAHSRTWAFQAISLIDCGKFSLRSKI
jgi:hypothetical protein